MGLGGTGALAVHGALARRIEEWYGKKFKKTDEDAVQFLRPFAVKTFSLFPYLHHPPTSTPGTSNYLFSHLFDQRRHFTIDPALFTVIYDIVFSMG